MKIYVISLARSEERRKGIAAQMRRFNLPFQFIDGFDRQSMETSDFERLCDMRALSSDRYLTLGVYACALSHRKAYEALIGSGAAYALILEDDVILPADGVNSIDGLADLLGEDDIILLSYYAHWRDKLVLSRENARRGNNGLDLLHPMNPEDVGSGMAYLISKGAAEILVSDGLVRYAADKWGYMPHFRSGEHLWCAYPRPNFMPGKFETTIDYQQTQRGILAKLRFAAAKLIRRIPLSYVQSLRAKRFADREARKSRIEVV